MSTKKAMDHVTQNKLPPHSPTAERAILGALFCKPDAFYEVATIMQADDFFSYGNTIIFNEMLKQLESEAKGFDLITVAKALEGSKTLESVGGVVYLAELSDAVPSAANITYHAKLVHDKAVARRVGNASIETVAEVWDDKKDAKEIVQNAEQRIMEATKEARRNGFSSMAQVVTASYAKIEQMQEHHGETFGHPTGFLDLDRMTGGLEPGKLIIVAARPAMGKSILATNMGLYMAEQRVPVLNFNLEMEKTELGMRSQCAYAKVDSLKCKSGTLDDGEWERLSNATERLSRLPYYIDDTAEQTVLDIKSMTRKGIAEYGKGAIFIDYLQLMTAAKEYGNRNLEIAAYTRYLKVMAKELDVPVVLLSQLSRKCEERADKRPILSDLRDSGGIEQDADIVMFIYRPEVYFDDEKLKGYAELIVAKHRNGPLGTIFLGFDGPHTRFVNIVKPEEEKPFG